MPGVCVCWLPSPQVREAGLFVLFRVAVEMSACLGEQGLRSFYCCHHLVWCNADSLSTDLDASGSEALRRQAEGLNACPATANGGLAPAPALGADSRRFACAPDPGGHA